MDVSTHPSAGPTVRRISVATPSAVQRDHLPQGDDGPDAITVTSRWFERRGAPWIPISGEVHYSRIARSRWADVLGHARTAGLDVVSSYVFWRSHEPRPGEFDWSDNLDLRSFIELAGVYGLDVVVRLGPWVHAEARYGGFPDWLVDSGIPTRTNDARYLDRVRSFYSETIRQLAGLTHADGGPVVGVQLDNELHDQPEHLDRLRQIAEELGLRVPIWTATGWGGAALPDSVVPTFSAYADGFWEDETTDWPPYAWLHFLYQEARDDLSVGADVRRALEGEPPDAPPLRPPTNRTPFALCEMGGGMPAAYHRRPLVTPQDIGAVALAKLGSGSAWQGYYMFAGGSHRRGHEWSEQESQATGYPNDLPRVSYDFAAPIGEHGQIRAHFHQLRRQHLWLGLDGHRLATMSPNVGGGGADPAELRWSVRSDGRSGYLFLTTYQPARSPLSAQPGVQLTVEFADGRTVTVPTEPVDVPQGVSLVWPLRYPLAPGVELRSATAQLLTRIDDEHGGLVVLAASRGIPPELVLEGDVPVAGAGVGVYDAGSDSTVVRIEECGPNCLVSLPGIRLIILDEDSADRLYRVHLAGRDRLALSDVPVSVHDDTLVVHSEAKTAVLSLFPGPSSVSGPAVNGDPADDGIWRTWPLALTGAGSHRLVEGLRPAASASTEAPRGGPLNRLSAPTDYRDAAVVQIAVPPAGANAPDRSLVRVSWRGDVARAFVGDVLTSDHFWHGREWDIDVTAWRRQAEPLDLRLELLPWRRATGVWVDPSVSDIPDGLEIAAVDLVEVARVALEVTDL